MVGSVFCVIFGGWCGNGRFGDGYEVFCIYLVKRWIFLVLFVDFWVKLYCVEVVDCEVWVLNFDWV